MSVAHTDTFEDQWCAWWDQINPEWRTRQDSRLAIGGEGDWSGMFMSGKNGFGTIIGSVVGLLQVASPPTIEYAIIDLEWTLSRVLEARRLASSLG